MLTDIQKLIVAEIDSMGWYKVAQDIRDGRRTIKIEGTDVTVRAARGVVNGPVPLRFPGLMANTGITVYPDGTYEIPEKV